jgi:hypothetical protein
VPLLQLPVPQTPPALADITNIENVRHRAAKRRRDYPASVSSEEVARAVIAEHNVSNGLFYDGCWVCFSIANHAIYRTYVTVVLCCQLVQRVAGDQVAPPWFATGLQPILQRLDAIEARQRNSGCADDADVLIPPRCGANAPPATAPTTVAALNSLSPAHLTQLETYYGLPHTDTLPARRRRLARAYGVLFATSSSLVSLGRG